MKALALIALALALEGGFLLTVAAGPGKAMGARAEAAARARPVSVACVPADRAGAR